MKETLENSNLSKFFAQTGDQKMSLNLRKMVVIFSIFVMVNYVASIESISREKTSAELVQILEDENTESFAFPINLNKGWNVVSFPNYINLDTEIRGSALVSNNCPDSTKIYFFIPTMTEYKKLGTFEDIKKNGNIFPLMPGLAVWMYAEEDCSFTAKGSTEYHFGETASNSEIEFPWVQLVKGWNLFGSSANQVNFDAIKKDCEVESGPWVYNSQTKKYEKTSELKPGQGYFLKLKNYCRLYEYEKPEAETLLKFGEKEGVVLYNTAEVRVLEIKGSEAQSTKSVKISINSPWAIIWKEKSVDATTNKQKKSYEYPEVILSEGQEYNDYGVKFKVLTINPSAVELLFYEKIISKYQGKGPTPVEQKPQSTSNEIRGPKPQIVRISDDIKQGGTSSPTPYPTSQPSYDPSLVQIATVSPTPVPT